MCPCPLCRDHGVGAEGQQPGGGHLPPPAPAHGDFQRLVRAVRCAADPLCPLGVVWSSLNEQPPCATVEGWHASQGKLPGQLTVNCVGGTARRPKDAGRAAQMLAVELAPDLVSLPLKIRCSDVATTCRCRRLSVAQPLHNLPRRHRAPRAAAGASRGRTDGLARLPGPTSSSSCCTSAHGLAGYTAITHPYLPSLSQNHRRRNPTAQAGHWGAKSRALNAASGWRECLHCPVGTTPSPLPDPSNHGKL